MDLHYIHDHDRRSFVVHSLNSVYKPYIQNPSNFVKDSENQHFMSYLYWIGETSLIDRLYCNQTTPCEQPENIYPNFSKGLQITII